MRVVIVGAAGQLGRELTRILPHDDLVSLTRADLDLQDAAAVTARLVALAPAAVVNAAADNRVDAAEEDPTQAVAVNALGVAAVARACRSSGAFFVQPSTDYVFDGRTTTPYTEEARPNPLGMYARSKLAGELLACTLAPRCAVVRVAGLYAAGGTRPKSGSFVDRVIARAQDGERLRIVADQVTAPTYARDVAGTLAALLPRWVSGEAPGGLYHVTNAGACSWFEFARAALELAGHRAALEPISSAAFGAAAPRPPYSVLANTRLAALGEPPLRPWRDALAAYLAGE